MSQKPNYLTSISLGLYKASQAIPEYDIIEQSHHFLSSFTIAEADVLEALTQLDTSKAVGIDGIGPRVLKHCAISLCPLFCHLFNVSLRTGSLPKSGKLI